jgi:membrane-associated phospholipid phosphatase
VASRSAAVDLAPRAAARGGRRLLRWAPLAAWAVALAVEIWRDGVPLARDALLVWLGLGLLAFALPRRLLPRMVVDWVPFAAILLAYDLLRGAADGLLFGAHTLPQIDADRALGAGAVPTVWLQQRLYDGAGHLHWYDIASWATYTTHFCATPLVAAVLWVTARPLFRRYVAAVSVLAAAGFATYALFPAVPPWLASAEGALPPVDRIVPAVWSNVHFLSLDGMWENGVRYANDVAAVPSLHAAYALLIALFLWPLARRRWQRALIAAYPLAMAWALVYTGEHYVVDVLAGWAYAVAALWAVDAWTARRQRSRSRARAAASSVSSSRAASWSSPIAIAAQPRNENGRV